jgi:hypothetical protein
VGARRTELVDYRLLRPCNKSKGGKHHKEKNMKANELKRLLENNRSLPVLHVSNPDGVSFWFGTNEELESEMQAQIEDGCEGADLTTAGDLANNLDFLVYEDSDIEVYK